MKDNPLTAEYVRSILDYHPYTGEFRWKERPLSHFRDGYIKQSSSAARWNTRYAGTIAGHQHTGYLRIDIDSKTYKGHHLAWLIATGVWPKKLLDHQDGNGLNNKISNLRYASAAENNRNAKLYSNNTSGVKGLGWRKNRNCWVARITVDYKVIVVGHFKTRREGLSALNKARKKYHGKFARTK
jgi:hypothetical protein